MVDCKLKITNNILLLYNLQFKNNTNKNKMEYMTSKSILINEGTGSSGRL